MTAPEASAEARIVTGVDGSDPSVAALQWGARHADITGATLEVLMAWEWPTNYGWAIPFPPDYDPKNAAKETLEEIVRPVQETYPKVNIRSLVVEGHPAPSLVEASKGADLLVVGSRGHGEFVGMLLGSVSEYCTAHAHCPVVVIRDKD